MARRIYLDASGLRVSKSGRDALSSNPDDLLVDTVHKNTTTFASGRLQGPGAYAGDYASGYGTYQIKAFHGFGFIPLFSAEHNGGGSVYVRIDGTYLTAEFYQQYSGSAPGSATLPGYVDFLIFAERWVLSP